MLSCSSDYVVAKSSCSPATAKLSVAIFAHSYYNNPTWGCLQGAAGQSGDFHFLSGNTADCSDTVEDLNQVIDAFKSGMFKGPIRMNWGRIVHAAQIL